MQAVCLIPVDIASENCQTRGWVWVTGEPVAYTNWNNLEPSGFYSNLTEDFAIIDLHAHGGEVGWGDAPSFWLAPYIVEYEAVPEPSSVVVMSGLFATMGIGMWWRRRRNAA